MAKLHKKILDTIGESARGIPLGVLQKRLHPLMPSAIQKAVTSLLDKGELEEVPGGRVRRLASGSSPGRGPSPSGRSGAEKSVEGAPRYAGRISLHRDGFGFVTPEDGSLPGDVFVPPGSLGAPSPAIASWWP